MKTPLTAKSKSDRPPGQDPRPTQRDADDEAAREAAQILDPEHHNHEPEVAHSGAASGDPTEVPNEGGLCGSEGRQEERPIRRQVP